MNTKMFLYLTNGETEIPFLDLAPIFNLVGHVIKVAVSDII